MRVDEGAQHEVGGTRGLEQLSALDYGERREGPQDLRRIHAANRARRIATEQLDAG